MADKRPLRIKFLWTFLVVCLLGCNVSVSSNLEGEFNGGKIAFVSFHEDNETNSWGNPEIYVINADGSQQIRLTDNPSDDLEPDWSPDGKNIVFRSNRDGNSELYLINVDNNQLTRLTNTPAHESNPSWSPEGSNIAFESFENERSLLKIIDVKTGEIRQLINGDFSASRPSWFSDGKSLLFTSGKDHENVYRNELYKLDIIDGSIQLLSNPDDYNTFVDPMISLDEQTVVFTTLQDSTIGLFNLTTKEISWMTDSILSEKLRASIVDKGQIFPSWSPDGNYILFSTASPAGRANIYIFNFKSSELLQVTNNLRNDLEPDLWMP